MQYKVPQDVQREDKIFGPFSLSQFLYGLGGAMAGYLAYSFVRIFSNELAFLSALIVFATIGSFAVIKVQGKTMPEFVSAFIVYSLRPRKRVWQRDISTPDIAYIPKDKSKKPEPIHKTKSDLDKLAHILDTRGWDELEKQTEQKEITTIHKKVKKDAPKDVDKEKGAPKTSTVQKKEKATLKVDEKPKIVKQKLDDHLIKEKSEKILSEVKKAEEKMRRDFQKRIKTELKEKEKEQKEGLKILKEKVKKIDKLSKEKPKKRIKKRKVTIHRPINQKPKEDLYSQEYISSLQSRMTTPQRRKPTINIKVDEHKLVDVLEETDEIKKLKREMAEIGSAIKKTRKRGRPKIIKAGNTFYSEA